MNFRPKLEKKRQICKDFFGIFELLEHHFLSEHFPKFICGEVFSLIVGCRVYLCFCIYRDFHNISLSGYFQFCFEEAVSKHRHEIICDRVY